jgi:hypothetical protein
MHACLPLRRSEHPTPEHFLRLVRGAADMRILQFIVDSRSARAIKLAMHEDCSAREQRMDNLALVNTLLKENEERYAGFCFPEMSDGGRDHFVQKS